MKELQQYSVAAANKIFTAWANGICNEYRLAHAKQRFMTVVLLTRVYPSWAARPPPALSPRAHAADDVIAPHDIGRVAWAGIVSWRALDCASAVRLNAFVGVDADARSVVVKAGGTGLVHSDGRVCQVKRRNYHV